MEKDRLHSIYDSMKQRCYNPNVRCYKHYGGRGINVCAEWLDKENVSSSKGYSSKGWNTFKNWALNNGYKNNLTLERIDVNKGYGPDNCRWASVKEQANNTRQNHFITYKGKTQTLMQWCEELNLVYNRVYKRIFLHNWNIEKAFNDGSHQKLIIITYKNKTQCLKDWCKELNLNYISTYKKIVFHNWSVNKAFETK